MTLTTYRTAPTCCAWCGHGIDAATSVETLTESRKPKAGDITICLKCGEWSVYARGQRLRKPTDKEFEHIAADRACQKLRWAWTETQKEWSPK